MLVRKAHIVGFPQLIRFRKSQCECVRARVLICYLCSSPSSASSAPPAPPVSPPPSAFADLPPVKAPADFDDQERHEESPVPNQEEDDESAANMRIIQVRLRHPVAGTMRLRSFAIAHFGGQGERQQQQRRFVEKLGTGEDRSRRERPHEKFGHQHRRWKGQSSLEPLLSFNVDIMHCLRWTSPLAVERPLAGYSLRMCCPTAPPDGLAS